MFTVGEIMSLKEALEKAGFKASKPATRKPVRHVNRGTKDSTRRGGKIHDHHHRTECDACRKTAPDVERYDHRNRSLNAKWLCMVCADHYQISDDLRMTAESDISKRRMFVRNYGHTCKL